jgi:hypothetical protein
MATIWKSTKQKYPNRLTNDTTSGAILSSWSRQQKLAMIAGFAILGLLLAVSACSKQSPKPALVAAASPARVSTTTMATETTPAASPSSLVTAAAPAKKMAKSQTKKRPLNVGYSDANTGVSFVYPRIFPLSSGKQAQPQLAATGEVPMNFVQPGGVAVATVEFPKNSYPGTDFEAAFFNVNINRNVSEQECEHFAFVDTRDADGEPVDAEKINVGSVEMEMTTSFSASMMKQDETQYYHRYERGACYEFVLGLGTGGYGAKDGIEPIDREEVFARLEKILSTVKVNNEVNNEVKADPGDRARSTEPVESAVASQNE